MNCLCLIVAFPYFQDILVKKLTMTQSKVFTINMGDLGQQGDCGQNL